MSDIILTTLTTKGVVFEVVDGQLRVNYPKGALTPQEIEWLRCHKTEIIELLEAQKVHNPGTGTRQGDMIRDGGRDLLYALWGAGYSLKLVRSTSNPTGYAIIPVGTTSPSRELLALYDAHHDQAVALLVDTCRRVGIAPEHWHRWVEKIAANSQKVLTEDQSWFSR